MFERISKGRHAAEKKRAPVYEGERATGALRFVVEKLGDDLVKALFAAGAIAAIASAAPAGAAPLGPPLAATVPQSADVRDLGRATPATLVSVSIVLRYRNEAQLDQLVEQQSDPASPLYAHFLSNAQFNAYFAPSQSDYVRVMGSLARAGFRVQGSDNRTVVSAIASAPVAERYFSTEIHRALQAGKADVRYLNVRPAIVPADIADVTSAVLGLDTLTRATPDHVFFRRSPELGPVDTISGKKLKGPDGGYGPFAVAQGFDYPVQHGFDGTGHAVAIAIDYDTSDTDLTNFAAYFSIKRTGKTVHVPVDGGQKFDPNGSVESTLDVETAGTLDPGADIYVYNFGAAFTFKEISDAYNAIVSDNKVDVANSSFGLCENNAPASFVTAVNTITKQGAAKGISFVASTGDFGRGGKCSDGTGQDVPAVLPFFTSVGGVDLTVNTAGKITAEPEDSGSGGGPSDIYPIPKYQVGVKGIFSTTKRNIPDVSGPYYPDSFYLAGRFQGPIGGTSWAAPATAAFIAEANQVEKARRGFANYGIYRAFKAKSYDLFNNITQGNNGIACGVGYSDCSGIGTLKAFPLAGFL